MTALSGGIGGLLVSLNVEVKKLKSSIKNKK